MMVARLAQTISLFYFRVGAPLAQPYRNFMHGIAQLH